jgi:5-methyltetrahydropteroyltriglutamate--homocysteine methyltransferase
MSKRIKTAISGSLPKPAWLAEPEKLWAPWQLTGQALEEAKSDAMRLAVDDQLRSGITVIGDGEQTRQHFVTTFIEHLNGVDFVNRKTVRIRNRYDADVPVVVDKVARSSAVFVEDAKRLRALTKGPIKFTLPGPMTMIDTLFDDYYKSREKLAWAFAEILNEEAKALAAVGVDVVQFDEPAFNVFFDEVRDWGVKTLERAAQGLPCKSAVHICYGYGIEANLKWKQGLGEEWRQYEQVFPLLAKSTIDQVSLECQNSRVPMEFIAMLRGKDVLVGAIDVGTQDVETPQAVANVLRQALQYADVAHIQGCTNCGLVTLPREVATAKLRALAAGAALLSEELGLE